VRATFIASACDAAGLSLVAYNSTNVHLKGSAMKRAMVVVLACIFLSANAIAAGGLDGLLSKLNSQAKSDLNNFSARISAQFGIPEAQVKIVLSTVKEPADAFMVFQIGKMSGHPAEQVLDVYQKGRGKGWGALAKELGIKPGSPEFHALKRGDFDLQGGPDDGHGKGKDKGKGKGKGKGNKDRH
jgi:hypothetical protein